MTPARPPFGLFRFTIEGRRAPALFVGGWLGTIVGGGFVAVGLLAAPSTITALILLAGLAALTGGLVLLGGSQAIERQAAGEPYGGPAPVLLLGATVSATLLVAALLGIALEAIGVSFGPAERPLGDLISVAVQAVVFIGMVRLMVVGSGALTWADMGFSRDPRRIAEGLLTGAVWAVPVIVLTSLVALVIVPLVGQTPPPSPLPPTGTASGLGLHLLAGAAIGPLAEETVFRAAALTAWLRTVGPTAAITRSALLFATVHVLTISGSSFGQAAGLAVVATAGRLPVAFALGYLYVRTRSIWAPVGLHAAFNAILIALGEVSQAAA
ncbi:MAG TPA: type II CAAX endopeptidase family protein [Candidatus Limnocylindrales bacterium]|nr:type II CAAX endopeptidase family protein [Candidatus Limnocylindrales bacterium]